MYQLGVIKSYYTIVELFPTAKCEKKRLLSNHAKLSE